MNEGHSAFLALERVVRLMETQKLSFREAKVLASASLIFTTHTPVAAGHDYFPPGTHRPILHGVFSAPRYLFLLSSWASGGRIRQTTARIFV